MMVKRRMLAKAAAGGGLVAATTVALGFPKPLRAQEALKWRMVTTWPKNFPGLGTGSESLARMINAMSGGRLTVEVFGAGEIVPPFESMDAVGGGTAEMGHGAPYYWKGKVSAAQFLSALPFGLTAQEQNAWFDYGGGQELADRVYAEMNTKFFPSGNTGCQMGGWFNKDIASLADFQGLKIRMPGIGGEVLKAAGATVVNLPGGEIPQALLSGTIDAVDWVGPYNDLAFGLYKSAKNYYYPGWHEPGGPLDCFVNLDAWNGLPGDLKAVIEVANRAVNQHVLNEFVARNNDSLVKLQRDHGVILKRFPDSVLEGLYGLSNNVVEDLASNDPLSGEILDSILAFRASASGWSEVSVAAFLDARAKVLG